MRILVFLHGTLLMPKNAVGKTREEIVQQVKDQEESVRDFKSYVPVKDASTKLNKWVGQGAQISYLTALTEDKRARGDEIVGKEGLKVDREILDRYDFPEGKVYHRKPGESYQDVVEKMDPLPDIIIEDDCESIGGVKEMTYPRLKPELKSKIKSIVIKEFGGIDHLPDFQQKI